MPEYQILEGECSHCQKVLNQWRHQYALDIISMQVYEDRIYILLTRTPRSSNP